MLFVTMPTFRTPPELLDRAVDSVLNSRDVDLHLIVLVDGDPKTRVARWNSRVTVFKLPDNRGRYFADAVGIAAASRVPGALWAPLDADDWVEPEHYARLAERIETGAVCSTYWRQNAQRVPRIQQPHIQRLRSAPPSFAHLFHWCSGMYSLDRVEAAGGIHPGFRVGFDTLFALMLVLTGPVNHVRTPGYHWHRRQSGSLTTSPATGFGSPQRVAARARLADLYKLAVAAKDRPGDVIRRDIPASLADQVATEADRLWSVL